MADAMMGKEARVIRGGGWPTRPGVGRVQPLAELRLGGSVTKERGGDANRCLAGLERRLA